MTLEPHCSKNSLALPAALLVGLLAGCGGAEVESFGDGLAASTADRTPQPDSDRADRPEARPTDRLTCEEDFGCDPMCPTDYTACVTAC